MLPQPWPPPQPIVRTWSRSRGPWAGTLPSRPPPIHVLLLPRSLALWASDEGAFVPDAGPVGGPLGSFLSGPALLGAPSSAPAGSSSPDPWPWEMLPVLGIFARGRGQDWRVTPAGFWGGGTIGAYGSLESSVGTELKVKVPETTLLPPCLATARKPQLCGQLCVPAFLHFPIPAVPAHSSGWTARNPTLGSPNKPWGPQTPGKYGLLGVLAWSLFCSELTRGPVQCWPTAHLPGRQVPGPQGFAAATGPQFSLSGVSIVPRSGPGGQPRRALA